MPKPLFGDNGSGMHTHISLWKGGEPLFAGSGYAGLSEMAHVRHRRHAQARPGDPGVQPTRRPTATSGWCPATRRRSTWPTRSATARPRSAFRCTARARRPSGSSSAAPIRAAIPYLAFSAMLMAVIDGIQNKIDPGEPLDKDIYDLPPEELAKVPKTPGSLEEALDALRERPRVPAAGRRVHRRRDRHLDLVQDGERSRRHAAASASVRVLPVL